MDYQIRHPKDIEEICKIFNILKVCFPKTDKAYYIKRILGDPNYNKDYTYLLIKNNSFISHVQLFKKKIYYYGRQLPIIGLGMICTLPEYRNKGYFRKLLKKVIQDISDKQMPFIILFTRIPMLYKRFKFAKIIRKYYLLKRKKAKSWERLQRKGLKIRKFNFANDIFAIMKIYENFFSQHFGPCIRKFEDWQSQLSYFNEDKKLFLVLEDRKEIKAYIRCKRAKQDNQKIIDIVEFACKSRDGSFLIYLLNYLFKYVDIDYLRIDSRFFQEGLAKFFAVKAINNSLLMYRFIKRSKKINRLKMKEMVFLESDAF